MSAISVGVSVSGERVWGLQGVMVVVCVEV